MAEEFHDAVKLAEKVLDEPGRDPDDALSMMSRQFLRQAERIGIYRPHVVPVQISDNGFPRRSRIDLYTPAETAIRAAMFVVEKAGAHPLLTEAVTLLGRAQERVADHAELDFWEDLKKQETT